jgi:sugar/nucleoside kinase (ribokinase family)
MDVVGIGITVVDSIVEVESLPRTDETVDALGHSFQGGGRAATALSALGRLGSKAGLVSVAGGDLYGKFCLEDLQYHCVDASHVLVDESADTNCCVVLAERDTGGRSFVRQFGTCRPLAAEDLPEEYIRSAKILLLSGMDAVGEKAARIVRGAGGAVVVDADEFDAGLERHLGLIDVLIAAEAWYRGLFKAGGFRENLGGILAKGPKAAVVTRGSHGCVGLDAEGFFELPAYPVPVADSTGAGDVFHGAYIYGMLQGWKSRECARFASAVSAVKCTVPGGRAGIPDLRTALHFMKTGEIDRSEIDSRAAFYRRGLRWR